MSLLDNQDWLFPSASSLHAINVCLKGRQELTDDTSMTNISSCNEDSDKVGQDQTFAGVAVL